MERSRPASELLARSSSATPTCRPSWPTTRARTTSFGRTSNPWNPDRTAGGSSGGAAAAVAAGMTPLEIGSDLGHSIRLPAHFCGVYGLKTTEHRVPLSGFFRPPRGGARPVRIMSCLGPIARDLDDVELALRIVAGPDGHDADVPPVPLASGALRPLQGLRLAVAPTLPGVTVASSVRQEVERVAARAADAGASVEERLPGVDWGDLSKLFMDLLTAITGVFSPDAEPRTLGWYLEALARRDDFIARWERFFQQFDGLVLPPAMATAFAHCESGAPVDVDGKAVSYFEHARLGLFCNLTGLPALVAPAAIGHDGLPIGVQIVGARWSELQLLQIARDLEQAAVLPGFTAPPGY